MSVLEKEEYLNLLRKYRHEALKRAFNSYGSDQKYWIRIAAELSHEIIESWRF